MSHLMSDPAPDPAQDLRPGLTPDLRQDLKPNLRPDLRSETSQATPPEVLFFDLETQYLFEHVGGYHPERLRLACAVLWSTHHRRFEHYLEENAGDLIRRLCQAQLVVGFNLLSFDYRVLAPYSAVELSHLPTLDMLREIHYRLGHRVSLAGLALATLGHGKTADGIQSVTWFRQGRLDLVLDYCRADVQVTRELFEFGWHYGYLLFPDRRTGEKKRVETPWGVNPVLRRIWDGATA